MATQHHSAAPVEEVSADWEKFDESALHALEVKVATNAQSDGSNRLNPSKVANASIAKPNNIPPSEEEDEVEKLLKKPVVDAGPGPKMILKRDPNAQTGLAKSSDVGPKQEKSLAQREREYELAKQRIFAGEASAAPVAGAAGAATGASSGNKKTGNNNNSNSNKKRGGGGGGRKK